MYCTNCGKELPSTDARFCMECGTAVETEPICSKCGSVLPYFVKYCPKCGEKTKGLVFDKLVFWNAKFDKLKLLNIYAPYIYMESACCQHVILQNIRGLDSVDIKHELKSLIIKDCNDLKKLYVTNKLTSLELSGCSVTKLSCSHRIGLTSLKLSRCSALEEFTCPVNQLTSLDFSSCNALCYIECCLNKLTSLDVSKNTMLIELSCYKNKLTSLDVSNNTALTKLSCHGNKLTSLDVNNNIMLTRLVCSDNQLTVLNIVGCKLNVLNCKNNQLTILDLRGNYQTPDAGQCILDCSNNPLEKIVLSRHNYIPDFIIEELISEYGDIITYVD